MILKEYELDKKAIFLDRDGVINKEKNYLYKISDFEFIEGVFEACKYLISLDYRIIVVTNQSGISRGFYRKHDFKIITSWMVNKFNQNGVKILDVFHCPHLPESNCNCRKPKPGMLIEAKNKYKLNLNISWMIGDSERDITAANLAGINKTVLVRTGHKNDESNSDAKFIINSIQEISKIIVR